MRPSSSGSPTDSALHATDRSGHPFAFLFSSVRTRRSPIPGFHARFSSIVSSRSRGVGTGTSPPPSPSYGVSARARWSTTSRCSVADPDFKLRTTRLSSGIAGPRAPCAIRAARSRCAARSVESRSAETARVGSAQRTSQKTRSSCAYCSARGRGAVCSRGRQKKRWTQSPVRACAPPPCARKWSSKGVSGPACLPPSRMSSEVRCMCARARAGVREGAENPFAPRFMSRTVDIAGSSSCARKAKADAAETWLIQRALRCFRVTGGRVLRDCSSDSLCTRSWRGKWTSNVSKRGQLERRSMRVSVVTCTPRPMPRSSRFTRLGNEFPGMKGASGPSVIALRFKAPPPRIIGRC